jgi:PAS domain-containing protein
MPVGNAVDGSGVTNSGVASRRAADLAEVAAALPDPVLLMSATGDLAWGNLAAERLFGVALADGIGRNMLEFMHPDDAEMALVSAVAMQRKEIGTLLALRIRGFDGWRLVEVRGASFHDDILVTLRDITDRRRWEVVSNDSALFQAVLQNSTSITMVLEADGAIRSMSAVVTRLLGHDQELLEGQPLARIVEDRDRVPRDVRRQVRRQELLSGVHG